MFSSEEEALKYDGFIGGRKKEKKKVGEPRGQAGEKKNVKFGIDSKKEFEKDEPVTQALSMRSTIKKILAL